MAEIYLNDIAHGRSGDKGDTSNVCVYARKPEYYKIIEREVTPRKNSKPTLATWSRARSPATTCPA